jgi:hypothetical protein
MSEYKRLIHDAAFGWATFVADRLDNIVMPSEKRDLFELLYESAKAALEAAFAAHAHERSRLNPFSQN